MAKKPKVLIWVHSVGIPPFYQVRVGISTPCRTLPSDGQRGAGWASCGTQLWDGYAKRLALKHAKFFASLINPKACDLTVEDWTGDEIVEIEV